ncbi:hypothetical protein [Tumebacillus lipolyticus]|uniref:YolD-like family protein n=1 Tax=Tumebacillus lipolyticus TaxID=1280370 RepID=A0ABW4ZV22_9BACL
MNRGNKIWDDQQTISPEFGAHLAEGGALPHSVQVATRDPQEEIEHRVQEAMMHCRALRFVVGEVDGEHTVEGRVVSYTPDTRSMQISNEWGEFLLPLQNIVRVLC